MRIIRHIWIGSMLLGAAACGSSADGGAGNNASTTTTTPAPGIGAMAGSGAMAGGGALEVFPGKVYTGFDGVNTYRAPVIVYPPPTGTVTWSVADPTIASFVMEGANATFTAKKAGDTTITVTVGGKSASAPLKVYAYTKAQYDAGAARYMTAADPMNPACVMCHGAGKGPDHTPTEVDADTDEEIQHTFTTGTDPEGRKIKDISEFADLLKGYEHTWKITDTEKVGLVAYLRALMPQGYPEYDAPTAEK